MIRSATYKKIQKWVQQRFGFVPETCWIAHCKEIYGLPLRDAPNRQRGKRVKPCPPEKQAAIKKAFQHFGLLHKQGDLPPRAAAMRQVCVIASGPAELRYDHKIRFIHPKWVNQNRAEIEALAAEQGRDQTS